MSGLQSRLSIWPAKAADKATITNKLNTADPTMVPTPTSDPRVAPASEVNSSGADEPAAMNVAPATSSDRSSFSEIEFEIKNLWLDRRRRMAMWLDNENDFGQEIRSF